MRLVALDARVHELLARFPCLGERRFALALRGMFGEPITILVDAPGDEVAPGLLEDRAALRRVRVEQGLAAPALEFRGELPAQVARVLEPGVDAVAAVGRM